MMRPMPAQELRMRPIALTRWRDEFARRIKDRFHPVTIIDLAMDQYVERIGKTDQPAIEHPMHRSRQREPVPHRVGTVVLHRTNVRRLHFRASPSV